jgi:AcrR family transcriptional regulator
MSIAERRARSKEALRQSILNAAVELMVEQGTQALSIRKIAEKIEYAPSTIYLYFQDKNEIVATICADVFEQLRDSLVEITSGVADPVEGLRRGLRCYIDFGIAHRNHYLITFCSPLPVLPPEYPIKANEAGNQCFGVLLGAVQVCMEAGRIPQGDALALSESIWMQIHGVTSLLITHYCDHDPGFQWSPQEVLIETTLDTILRGVLANPSEVPHRQPISA